MTDEKKNSSPDDEYQFPQDEYASSDVTKPEMDAAAPVDEVKKTRAEQIIGYLRHLPEIKNKRIIIVVAAVIIVIIAFRIFHRESVSVPPTQPVAQAPTPVAPVVQPPSGNDVMGSLDALRAHSSRTESQLQDFRAQVSDMQNAINQAQTSNQELQKSVADLTAQMQSLSTRLEQALIKVRAPAKGKRVVFHLRAVLPDRAWITSNTGQTVSVTVGNHIEQYGTVQSIDVQRGIVNTSSGRKIEYGTNDY